MRLGLSKHAGATTRLSLGTIASRFLGCLLAGAVAFSIWEYCTAQEGAPAVPAAERPALFDLWDSDQDELLRDGEVPKRFWDQIAKADRAGEDGEKDGVIDLQEFLNFLDPQPSRYGIWSLVPAVLALTIAYTTQQVLLALFLGVVSGSVVIFLHTQVLADLNFLKTFLVPALGTSKYAVILLVYLWFLGGILGVWGKTGGSRYFAEKVGSRLAGNARGSKVFAWLVGCIFHQGGTVSTVLAGTTVKPVADKHQVSHEELAYIVDSTASPVATLIPFNAWPLYIAGLVAGASLQNGYTLIPTAAEGTDWFLSSIRFNFYAIFALLSTLLLSLDKLPWTGRKMRAAMERSRSTGKLDADDSTPLLNAAAEGQKEHEGYPTGLADFFLPIGVLLGIAIVPFAVTFYMYGKGVLPIGEAFLTCTISAIALAVYKGMPLRIVLDGFLDGCKSMTLGGIILGLAMTLGNVSTELGTAPYLIDAVGGLLPPWTLPALLTGICMVIAFAIGSSFGTYAVIFPLAVPLALQLALNHYGLQDEPTDQLATSHPEQWAAILIYVQICFGAVMGGSVFGDQCSPISDTTILSSMFTGCDLMDHVKTQLPLALAAALLGAVCSTFLALISL